MNTTDGTRTPATRSTRGAWRRTFVPILGYIILTTFAVSTNQVEQHSMSPTFAQGDRIIVDRLSTLLHRPYAVGDVIVFPAPAGAPAREGEMYVKRVLGLPGDRIEILNGAIYRNGVRVAEPFLPGGTRTEPLTGVRSWSIGKEELFVLGDNRAGSLDSRVFGPITTKTVVGRAIWRYWPISAFGPIPGGN